MRFIEELMDFAAQNPGRPALSDGSVRGQITYGRLARLSGRVYHYLKARGIGREDFVNILLPRGVEAIVSMIGVWRAGAAFVVLEEGYPADRIQYIQKDCGCKLVLDYAVWQEIQRWDPLPGFETVDDHDAAFAVYTSGSTGSPKGVLHEYGNLDRCSVSLGIPTHRFGLIAPLYFVATQIAILITLHYGGAFFVLPYATIKNPAALMDCYVRNDISETFCAPSIYPLFSRIPSLRVLVVSSEPAYGIWSEDPGLEVYNVYAMSESGLIVAGKLLDAPNEIAPIGQPRFPLRIVLRDESGKPVPDGEAGELCFENPFVRGYINRPEEGAHTFIDGETHTHDLARRLPNGDYVILGRIDDMIKVNGNRVEPNEIEVAARRVIGLNDLLVRGFDVNGSTQICLYYAAEAELDAEATRKALQKQLPYYMIPSRFIRLEKLPRTQSGKLSRQLLPRPDISASRGEYVPPENGTERALCDAMAKALNLDRVSATEDFYDIGGSSIASIQLVGECALPGLNVSQIFRGRTPRKIAALYQSETDVDETRSEEERNRAAMERAYPLTAEQRYMLDYLLYSPKTAMFNLYDFFRLSADVDAERFAQAVNATLQSHPALLTAFAFGEDSALVQRYAPELFVPVVVERVTEAELEALKATLVAPFALINHLMFRIRIFRTEAALYFFIDINHLVADGTSIMLLLREIVDRYLGSGEIVPSEPDQYYLMLSRREALKHQSVYAEDRAYYERRYGGVRWSKLLNTEIATREDDVGSVEQCLKLSPEAFGELMRNSGLGKNGLFIAAELLALAAYNQAQDVMISWVYKGRDDQSLQKTVGMLFREFPVAVRIHEKTTLRELFSEVQDQVSQGIVHSSYPWLSLNASPQSNDNISLNYQDMIGAEKELRLAMEELDLPVSADASPCALEIEIVDDDGDIDISATFSSSRFRDTEVTRFMNMIIAIFNAMLEQRERLDITLDTLFKGLDLDLPRP